MSQTLDLSNTISSLSLILGIYVALLLKVYDKIKQAFDQPIEAHKSNNKNGYKLVKRIVLIYVTPLTIFSLILSVIIGIIWLQVVSYTFQNFSLNADNYDIVLSIFILIGILSFVLTVYLITCLILLAIKLRRLNHK